MSVLDHGNETTLLLRAIEDALWHLRDGCIPGAKAALRSAAEKERLRQGHKMLARHIH